MTVSVDWLERFAQVFTVSPSSLIQDQNARHIPCLGTMTKTGMIRAEKITESIELSATAEQPVAVRLDQSIGDYRSGALLIGNRLERENMCQAHGLDSLVALSEDSILLSKVIWHGETAIIAPLYSSLPVQIGVIPQWIAPIIMEVRYF